MMELQISSCVCYFAVLLEHKKWSPHLAVSSEVIKLKDEKHDQVFCLFVYSCYVNHFQYLIDTF